MFVPQQEAWVVERMGKFYKTLNPVSSNRERFLSYHLIFLSKGLNILLPVIDTIRYVQSLKEIAIEIPSQTAISKGRKKFCLNNI